MEKDIECLYDVNVQSEVVSVMSKESDDEITKALLLTKPKGVYSGSDTR